jgi:hypothetical protein
VTPGAAASTPASAFPSLEKFLANDELRNLQADYQDLLRKEAENAGTVHQLQSKISNLSCSIEWNDRNKTPIIILGLGFRIVVQYRTRILIDSVIMAPML